MFLAGALLAGCGEDRTPGRSAPEPTRVPSPEGGAGDPASRSGPAATAAADATAVRAALLDPDPGVRLAAVRGAAEAGSVPADLALPLAGALRDENRWVREWAARALERLGAEAAPAVPALVSALHDEDSFVRWRAAQALAAIGPAARDALPRLEEVASSKDETEIGRHWARVAADRVRGER